MIHSRNIDPNAAIRASQLENYGAGIVSVPFAPPAVRWVSSTHASAADTAGRGVSRDEPYATLAFAVADVDSGGTANNQAYTLFICDYGHVESISVADALKWVADGYWVMSAGEGELRATFTFDTSTAATIVMDRTGLVFANCKFVVGIDALVLMFNVTAAGCQFRNCLLVLDDSDKETLIGINLGNVAADRVRILACEFEALTVGCNSAIKIATAVNDPLIAGCRVFGDFGDACIHNPTGNVATNLLITRNHLTNTQTGDHAIELVSACTGDISYNTANSTLAAVATKTAIDPGSCRCIENYGSDGVGDVSGLLNPTVDA